MAKQKKRFDFKAFRAELKQIEKPRSTGTQRERKYFLIVCEGTKTEPNYFNSLIDLLPNHLVNVEVVGEGRNTIDVVKKAIQLRDKKKTDQLSPPFDEVWAIFDKDEFPNKRFNDAITLGENNEINTAYSNEAFELWYVLHFQYLDAEISRNEYIEILNGVLGSYEKNAHSIYTQLQEKGNEEQAITYAVRLLDELQCGNPAHEKPTTRVHELVQNLNEFKR